MFQPITLRVQNTDKLTHEKWKRLGKMRKL